jgi:hypothetical protein
MLEARRSRKTSGLKKVECIAVPPFRQEEGERMGHGAELLEII